MSWMHGWSGRAYLSSQLDNADLMESTLTIDGYMWKRSSQLKGISLYIETINYILDGSLSSDTSVQDCEVNMCKYVQHAL
jgi:hypothetical protein